MFYLLVQVYLENRSRFRRKFGTNNVVDDDDDDDNNNNKEHKFKIIIRNKVIKSKNTAQKFEIYVHRPYWKM